jgi:hypothetical protein
MKCSDCKTDLPLKVLKSAAGYYVGRFCPMCGPYSRESGYHKTNESAQEELRIMNLGDEE